MQSFGFIALLVAYLLGMFATARRKNGFAAVHDLLTGTRVIQKPVHQPRTLITQAEPMVGTTEAMPVLGPYHVLSTLSQNDCETILLGYDAKLLRKVWIRQTKSGEPPVPQRMRNLARPARLRWLQGERTASESWDVYEAVGGVPLVNLLHESQPWGMVRYWLHDLSTELDTAVKDASLPDVLSLDRVWITTDGHVKLLNFTAPGARHTSSASGSLTGRAFINQVAKSALEGRICSAEEAAGMVEAPVALSARKVLCGLTVPAALQDFTAEIKPLLLMPPSVPWWKRLATTLICAAPAVGMGVLMFLGALIAEHWQKTDPELMPMLTTLEMNKLLQAGEHDIAKALNYPINEARADMEIIIAGRYGHILRDPKLWSEGNYKILIQGEQRATIERIVAAHPRVSAEELKLAEGRLHPLVGTKDELIAAGPKMPEMTKLLRTLGHIMFNWVLVFIAAASLLCAAIFRLGPLFRLLGVAVVTRDGNEASRLRLLGRTLIAWSPVLLSALTITLVTDPSAYDATLLQYALQVAAIVVFAFASLALRKRSLQDIIAGTWMVPR